MVQGEELDILAPVVSRATPHLWTNSFCYGLAIRGTQNFDPFPLPAYVMLTGIVVAPGTAKGGDTQTDPELTLLSLLSDNAADGGWSGSGNALGGAAGNIA